MLLREQASARFSLLARTYPPSCHAVYRSQSHPSRCSLLLLCTRSSQSFPPSQRMNGTLRVRKLVALASLTRRVPESRSPWRRIPPVHPSHFVFPQCPSRTPSPHARRHDLHECTDACARTCADACVRTCALIRRSLRHQLGPRASVNITVPKQSGSPPDELSRF